MLTTRLATRNDCLDLKVLFCESTAIIHFVTGNLWEWRTWRSCWCRIAGVWSSWLQNKQEKWGEIYAIRVFYSNPARCSFLHLSHRADNVAQIQEFFKYRFCVYIVLSLAERMEARKERKEKKVSRFKETISRSMLMLIASFDGDLALICGMGSHRSWTTKVSFEWSEHEHEVLSAHENFSFLISSQLLLFKWKNN